MTWQQTIDEEKDIAFEEGIERGEEKKPWSLRKIFSEKEYPNTINPSAS